MEQSLFGTPVEKCNATLRDLFKFRIEIHLSVKLLSNFEHRCQDGTAGSAKLKCVYQLRKDLTLEKGRDEQMIF